MSDPFLAHSEISNEIYIICGKKKYPVTEQVISAMKATGRLDERSHGEWIKGEEISRTMLCDTVLHIEYKDYTCSNCGLVLNNLLYHVDGSPFYKFCPNCGADMGEEKKNDN